jgi:hypothetical protein
LLEKDESAMSRDALSRRFNGGAVRTAQDFLEPPAPALRLTGSNQPIEGAAMIRTPIATTEDLDNATFFASSRLADLLRGDTGFDLSEDELDFPHFDDAVDDLS